MRSFICFFAVLGSLAAGASAAPFVVTPDRTIVVIDLSNSASLQFSITVRATEIAGIGAVSGFSAVSIATNEVVPGGSLAATVLDPFRSAPFSNGTSGAAVAGLFGGQFVLPPSLPIQFASDLLSFSYTETAMTERAFQIRVSGRGGVFLTTAGSSLVPFETLGEAVIDVRVVIPNPATAIPFLFVMNRSRRRAD
jgi:hypothetical protein